VAAVRSDPHSWDDLVAAVYEAAVDDEAWSHLAGSIGRAFDSDSVVIWGVDEGRPIRNPSITFPESYVVPYNAYYHSVDPWFSFSSGRPGLTVWLSDEIMPERDFRETEFYVDFSHQVGACHVALSSFYFAPKQLGCINIMRPHHASPFDEPDRRRLERLLLHLLRAFQIKSRFDVDGRAGVGFSALDALAFGTLVCDREARVLFANEAAEALARTCGAFKLGARHEMSLPHHEDDRKLKALVLDAALGGAGGGLRITTVDAADLLILVAPLPQRFAKDGARNDLALVAIRAADDHGRLTAATVGTMFRLTPAEADLAFALFSGLSLAEFMAEKLVSESTVRTHLTRVLHKTDCRNQRELVNLMGRLPQLR
jgi:DNA-binding CsgD family transcriptional regulator